MKKFRMPIKFAPEDYGKVIGPDGTLVDPGSSGSGGFVHGYAEINVGKATEIQTVAFGVLNT